MSVRLVEPDRRPRIGLEAELRAAELRAAEPRPDEVLEDRASAVVVEPHQQPGTTQAPWIGRPSITLVPILLR